MEVFAVSEFIGELNGVLGEIVVDENGNVKINLDLSSLNNELCDFKDNKESYLYHIHNEWNSDDLYEKYGDDCNLNFIGDHLNPFNSPLCNNINEEITYFNCKIGDS